MTNPMVGVGFHFEIKGSGMTFILKFELTFQSRTRSRKPSNFMGMEILDHQAYLLLIDYSFDFAVFPKLREGH